MMCEMIKNQETIEDIVADIRAQNQGLPEDSYALSPLVCDLLSLADRIEAAEKRADDQWRAAFAKIESVVTLQYAKRNLGDKGKIAVAEIMSACRFPDGALHEYERAFAENARLRAALKTVLDCKVMGAVTAEIEPGKSEYCAAIIEKAQRIYYEG